MKPVPTMIERMAEAYWNAFRDGYIAVGGRPESYPTWSASRDPVKDETLRCLLHAVEVLRVEINDGQGGARWDHLFPDKPVKRRKKLIPTDDAFIRQHDMGKIEDQGK